ncbi:MAG: IS110 family transposase [Solirubrobacteraceae bacterium]
MPDVISNAPADVRLWVSLDVHKFSIVAATLPPAGGQPEVRQIETTRAAIRRFVEGLGGPEGLAVCYEAGPGGFALLRLLIELGVACDVIAPSLIPVRAGDRVKTDRRNAKKLVRLYRGGQLSFVAAPSSETEGLRDLMRCRDDLRCARTAARNRVSKQLLRHGRIFRDGKTQWTLLHRQWIARQRLDDNLAHAALEQMLLYLDGLDRQIDALDRDLEQIARSERWAAIDRLLPAQGSSFRRRKPSVDCCLGTTNRSPSIEATSPSPPRSASSVRRSHPSKGGANPRIDGPPHESRNHGEKGHRLIATATSRFQARAVDSMVGTIAWTTDRGRDRDRHGHRGKNWSIQPACHS